MALPPPVLKPGRIPLPDGGTMVASVALGAGWRAFLAHPLAALLGLMPLAPIAALDLLKHLSGHALVTTVCTVAAFIFLGPATVGCWRHYLRLTDGARPSPTDWFAGYRFVFPTLIANILRMVAVSMAVVPAVLLLTVYLFVVGSGLVDGGPPSASDIAVFLLVATPAAAGIICIKCLTYPFEIFFADGRASRFTACLDAAVRLAWRNIRPIAWIFTIIGLVAIPLIALAFFAAPMLPQPAADTAISSEHPIAESLPNIRATEQALRLCVIPLLPWIFLTLAHAHRQALPSTSQTLKETHE